MTISLWFILLIVLVLLAFGGTGYGYYHGAPYSSPLAIVGTLLLVGLIIWLLLGGSIWIEAPPATPPIVVPVPP